jgi:hypothetical protein
VVTVALYLAAASRSDELSFVALVDVASVFDEAHCEDWRLIGGQMVQLHANRLKLGADLYRETRDADIGVPPVVVKEFGLVDRLRELGYEKAAGERLEREGCPSSQQNMMSMHLWHLSTCWFPPTQVMPGRITSLATTSSPSKPVVLLTH